MLAGAGSGKTRVITEKIAYLIDSGAEPARAICALTFTNKAAREMRGRVGKRLGRGAAGLTISTFHSLGLMILRRSPERFGLQSGFSIFDANDSLAVLNEQKQLLEAATPIVPVWRARIGDWKNHSVTPEQALADAETEADQEAAEVYAAYQRRLSACNAVDFDDLPALPARAFAEDERLARQWQGRLRYLLVDEYQDTNACQYAMLKGLVGERGALTAVGDDDQSIYTWRGANPENLNQLQADFPTLAVIKLEQNYRCSGAILETANTLIANNPHLFEKTLWTR